MRIGHDTDAVEIDLDRVLWDAEYRRRVIDSLKQRQEFPTDDTPPLGRDRAPAKPPSDESGTDPAAAMSSPRSWPGSPPPPAKVRLFPPDCPNSVAAGDDRFDLTALPR